jgi:hypothetical protein
MTYKKLKWFWFNIPNEETHKIWIKAETFEKARQRFNKNFPKYRKEKQLWMQKKKLKN